MWIIKKLIFPFLFSRTRIGPHTKNVPFLRNILKDLYKIFCQRSANKQTCIFKGYFLEGQNTSKSQIFLNIFFKDQKRTPQPVNLYFAGIFFKELWILIKLIFSNTYQLINLNFKRIIFSRVSLKKYVFKDILFKDQKRARRTINLSLRGIFVKELWIIKKCFSRIRH